jgi:hypothetical protein
VWVSLIHHRPHRAQGVFVGALAARVVDDLGEAVPVVLLDAVRELEL